MDFGPSPLIGAIADDLTGATDLALMLTRGGMRVRQVVGVPENSAPQSGADAIVVALKTRTVPASEAVAQSLAAARHLLAAGVTQLYFKYCSTFDSTDDGNIGPVIDALMTLTGAKVTLACPAFPTNKRTVYKGHLFVGDKLLSESSMKHHPLTPMTDSDLVAVLGRQTTRNVSLIDIATVRAGAAPLRASLRATAGIAIVDALDDDDLKIIGEAACDLKLVTGGSGIAVGLPANFKVTERRGTIATPPCPNGRAVVLSGSCSEATRQQVATALESGMPGFLVDPVAIADGTLTPNHAVDFARAAPGDAIPVIYATAAPDRVREAQERLGRVRAGTLVEDFLSEVAVSLSDHGFDRFLVAGGESSGAVIAGLGVVSLEVGREIDPGVPWMFTTRKDRPLALALKSGNFGAKDIFTSAWEKLR